MAAVPTNTPSFGKGVAMAGSCLVILGTMPIIANSRPTDFDALSFAFFLSAWQVVFSLPLLLGELGTSTKGIFSANLPATTQRRTIFIIIATGAIFGLSTYCYVLAVEKAGAVNAAIALQAYPLFAILWESVFLKRHKSAAELALTGVLIAALTSLMTGGTFRLDGLSVWFLVAVAVPFLWSVAHVIIREVLTTTPITPAQVTSFRVVTSTVFLCLALLVHAGPDSILDTAMRIDLQKFAVLMGLVYYLELILWFYAMRHIAVSVASSITVPSPALTMVLAALVLREPVAPYQVIAFAVITAALYGLILLGNQRVRKAKASPGVHQRDDASSPE